MIVLFLRKLLSTLYARADDDIYIVVVYAERCEHIGNLIERLRGSVVVSVAELLVVLLQQPHESHDDVIVSFDAFKHNCLVNLRGTIIEHSDVLPTCTAFDFTQNSVRFTIGVCCKVLRSAHNVFSVVPQQSCIFQVIGKIYEEVVDAGNAGKHIYRNVCVLRFKLIKRARLHIAPRHTLHKQSLLVGDRCCCVHNYDSVKSPCGVTGVYSLSPFTFLISFI